MAARYITQYALNGLTQQQFTMLIYEACLKLRWQMTVEGGNIVLITPRSATSYGEKVIIAVEADTATIESRHKQWQLGGKKKNAKTWMILPPG